MRDFYNKWKDYMQTDLLMYVFFIVFLLILFIFFGD
jgi:hypothetical protein